MALPSFVATGTLNEILGEVASDELVQAAATRAVISLTSNHNTDFPLVWEGEINWLKQPLLARVNSSGEIVNEDGTPLRLLARHNSLVPNLQWSMHVDLPPAALPPTPGGRLRKFTFDAGDDGETLNLATVTPVASVQGIATVKGSPVDSVTRVGNNLKFWVGGTEVGSVSIADFVVGSGADLSTTPSASQVIIASSTGTDATIAAANGSNAGVMTSAMQAKLAGIETGADVTDGVNVDAAGAVMNTDTSVAAMNFVIDEDSFASNTATKVPTQQSVKAYVDAGGSTNKIDKSIVDAKGDLIAGTAADTVARQAVGANGTKLIADSSKTSGLAWMKQRATTLERHGGGVAASAATNNTAWTAALAENANYAEIELFTGTYAFSGITPPEAGYWTVRGAGPGNTILENTHASNSSVKILGNASTPFSPWSMLRDLTLDASAVNAGQKALEVELAINFDVVNVDIKGHDTGIKHTLSWSGAYRNVNIDLCTNGFHFAGAAASTPVVTQNINIFNCGKGLWLENGMTGLSWQGGTIGGCTTVGMLAEAYAVRAIGMFGVVFERNAEDVILGSASAGPASVLFSNCEFLHYSATTPAQTRSVWLRNGASVTFDTCQWLDHTPLAIQQDAGFSRMVLINPLFENTGGDQFSKAGTVYAIPFSASYVSSIGWEAGGPLIISGDGGRLREGTNVAATWVAAPGTTTSTGKEGQIAEDGSFFYVCTATNTWRRTTLSTW